MLPSLGIYENNFDLFVLNEDLLGEHVQVGSSFLNEIDWGGVGQ